MVSLMTIFVRYEDSEGKKKNLVKKICSYWSLFLTLVSDITLKWVQIFFFFLISSYLFFSGVPLSLFAF